MQWRLDDMIAFLHVVEAGSMTAVARRLKLSKSVVSNRISDLEAVLDQELLRRSTRRVVPTDQSHALYTRMRPLLRELDEVVEEIAEREGALLRIGWLNDSSLVARKLCVSRRVVCCSPAYAAARGLPSSIEELSGHPCIDYANVHASRLWQFEPARSGGKPRSVTTHSRIVANNGEAIRDAAIAGLGLVLLPDFLAAEALRQGTLLQVLPNEEPLPYTVAAVYPPTRHVPRKLRALVDHLVREFRQTPPWERPAGSGAGSERQG
jgi:DNA-binding transcriptional LysR family regulator